MNSVRLLFLVVVLFASSCERAAEPGNKPKAAIEKSAASESETVAVEPDLTDEQLESLIFGDTNEGSPLTSGSLSSDQQATLREALDKATDGIEFGHLASTIASQVAPGTFDQSGIERLGRTMRTLSREEAEELGIDLGSLELTEDGSGAAVSSSVQMIMIEGGDKPSKIGSVGGVTVTKVEPITVENEEDPERAKRIQELLKSGDSNALAKELTGLIQGAVDTASLQQVLGE